MSRQRAPLSSDVAVPDSQCCVQQRADACAMAANALRQLCTRQRRNTGPGLRDTAFYGRSGVCMWRLASSSLHTGIAGASTTTARDVTALLYVLL